MAEALAKMEPLNIISAPAQTVTLANLCEAADSPEAAESLFLDMCDTVGAFCCQEPKKKRKHKQGENAPEP